MPRPRIWYVAILLVLAPGAACASHSGITADSTCGDYLSTQTDTRHAAATRISTDLHARGAGKPIWGTSLDTECAAAPGTTLRKYFAVQLAQEVQSVAMEHTINSGDTILVNTLAYAHGAPRRGEVVLFNAPPTWSADPTPARFVKRVVGTGGDHVVCCDPQHRLVLNGHPLDEPDGRLWVLGDHRSSSGDSLEMFMRIRDIGQAAIPVDAMVGRAFAVIDPHGSDAIHELAVPSSYADVPTPNGH